MFSMRGKSKRRIAAFLAICMLVASLQGTAMATVTEGNPPETTVFSLSTEEFRDAAADAVIKGHRYDESMDFFGGETPAIAAEYLELLGGDNVFELERIPYENRASASDLPDGSSLRIFICADRTQLDGSGESADKASDSELKTSGSRRRASASELEESKPKASGSELKASDSEMRQTEYEVTGDEQIIFLFTNNTKRNLTFQLNIDGNLLQSIYVPSGETLGYGAATTSEASEAEMDMTDEEDAAEVSETEESSLADELDELPLAKSSKEVSRVTAFEPKPSYDRDDPDAPKSPEEEFEMMGLEDDEEYEGSEEPAEVSKVLEPVLIKEQPQGGLARMFSRTRTQKASGTAVLYLTTLNAVEGMRPLAPKISKAAWKDNTKQGEYDIALQVTGDSVENPGGNTGANVLFVLDSSGSMKDNSRWKLVKDAVKSCLDILEEKDNIQIAMFRFSTSANANKDEINWSDLNGTTRDAVNALLSYNPVGGTMASDAFAHAQEVFSRPRKYNKDYLIFLTDGEPGMKKDDGDAVFALHSINARKQGDILREQHPDMGIYMIGLGSGVNDTNSWWMNRYVDPPTGKLESYYNDQTRVDYPTDYLHAKDGSLDLEKIFSDLANKMGTTHVFNPIVTDILSDKVEPIEDPEVPGAPIIWQRDGAVGDDNIGNEGVSGTTENPIAKLFAKRSVDNSTFEYYKSEAERDNPDKPPVAKYLIADRTISWTVTDNGNLPENTTKSLIYRVKALNGTEGFVKPDENTGTHSMPGLSKDEAWGYYSNKKAILTFEDGELQREKHFLHPVVQPYEDETYGSLEIKKMVTDNTEGYYKGQKFEFTVELINVTVEKIFVGPNGDVEKYMTEDGTEKGDPITNTKWSIFLEDDESYKINGLNKDASYIITENDYKSGPYYSELVSIIVGDDEKVNDGKTITGSFSDGNGTSKEGFIESARIDGEHIIVYGNKLHEIDGEDRRDGWYDGKGFIEEGDERFYNVNENVTINSQTQEEVILRWIHQDENGSHVIAEADGKDSNSIRNTQNEVVNWLRGADGGNFTHFDVSSADYSVLASKKGARYNPGGWFDDGYIETERTQPLLDNGKWGEANWDNGSPDEIESNYIVEGKDNPAVTITVNKRRGETRSLTTNYKYYYRSNDRRLFERVELRIKTESSRTPGKPYWEYNGERYGSVEALEIKLREDGHKNIVSNGDSIKYDEWIRRTNLELFGKGYKHRVYTTVISPEQAGEIKATFTNTFNMDATIKVVKQVKPDPGVDVPDNEEYTFNVEKIISPEEYANFDGYEIVDNNTALKDGSKFTITGAGEVKLKLLDPNDYDSSFRITEINKDSADVVGWVDEDNQIVEATSSGVVKIGGTVTCINRYTQNNSLTISKVLSANSSKSAPDEAKIFQYEVTLTTPTGSLDSVGYDVLPSDFDIINKGMINKETKEISLDNNGTFNFTMKSGGNLILSDIPKGTSYTVKELSEIANGYPYYQFTVTNTLKNGLPWTEDVIGFEDKYTVIGVFGGEKSQTVQYENELSKKISKITLIKEIIGADKVDEGKIFIFKVTNDDADSKDYGKAFYVPLEIRGGSAIVEDLEVPYAAEYVVTEEAHLGYKAVGSGTDTIVMTEAGPYEAKIQNERVTNGYFTDSKVLINTVDENGFPNHGGGGVTRSMPASTLPSDPLKEQDESGDEN